nr:hypothetical protein NG677_11420 [Methylobacterium sp. OTU13CASTA1]
MPDRRERPLTRRLALASLLTLAAALPAGTPVQGASRDSAPAARRNDGFAHLCEPPLKFAAGTCVRDCPAGYRDTGLGTCSFQRMGD